MTGDGAARDRRASRRSRTAGPSHLSFFSNRKYRKAFEATRAGAVIVEPGRGRPAGPDRAARSRTRTSRSRRSRPSSTRRASRCRRSRRRRSIHPTARGPPERPGDAARVRRPRRRDRARGQSSSRASHVGEDVAVGADCIVYHNVVIRERCVVGDRVILQPGCVIGSDGFGFALDMEGDGHGPRHYKVPQAGIVVIEDDVEIGANSCVDRATLGVTRDRPRRQDRQPRADRPQRRGRPALHPRVAGRDRRLDPARAWAWSPGGRSASSATSPSATAPTSPRSPASRTTSRPGRASPARPAKPDVQWARNSAVFDRLTEMRRELRELRAGRSTGSAPSRKEGR